MKTKLWNYDEAKVHVKIARTGKEKRGKYKQLNKNEYLRKEQKK